MAYEFDSSREPSTLTVILDWYKTLNNRARSAISLAQLHQLSKDLRAIAPASDALTWKRKALEDCGFVIPDDADENMINRMLAEFTRNA